MRHTVRKFDVTANGTGLTNNIQLVNCIHACYQFRVPRNLRIDIKDRLEEYSQSIEIDIHDCTQSQKSLSSQILTSH